MFHPLSLSLQQGRAAAGPAAAGDGRRGRGRQGGQGEGKLLLLPMRSILNKDILMKLGRIVKTIQTT